MTLAPLALQMLTQHPWPQAGNDFLPSIPSLEIYGRPSGLDILLKIYKEQLPALGGPIINGVALNPDRLKRMLTKLAEDEEDSFKRASVSCGASGVLTHARCQKTCMQSFDQQELGLGLGRARLLSAFKRVGL